jgi:hypothetical protein
LSLLPYLTGHDHWQIILVAELLLRVCEAEGLIDLIALALVADQGPDVAFISQDSRHHRCVPQIFFEDAILGIGQSLVQKLHLHESGRFSSLLIQHTGDGFHAASADVSGEDESNRFGCFIDNDDFLCVLVLEVPEGRNRHKSFLLFLSVSGADSAATISGIEVVDQTFESDDEIVVLVEGVDIFRRRQDSHIVFTKVVNEECGLRPVTAKTGQVFDDNGFDFTCLDRFIDIVDTLALKCMPLTLSSKDSPTTSWPLLTAKLYMIFLWLFRELSSSSSSLDSR